MSVDFLIRPVLVSTKAITTKIPSSANIFRSRTTTSEDKGGEGLSIGENSGGGIRDRKMLAEDGIFVVIALVDTRTGRLKKSPDIIARGFVYLRESQEL